MCRKKKGEQPSFEEIKWRLRAAERIFGCITNAGVRIVEHLGGVVFYEMYKNQVIVYMFDVSHHSKYAKKYNLNLYYFAIWSHTRGPLSE